MKEEMNVEAVVAQILEPKDEIPVNPNVFLIVTSKGDMYEYGRELGNGEVNYLREIGNLCKSNRMDIYTKLKYWKCAISIDQIPFMLVRTVGYIENFSLPSKVITDLCTEAFDFINGDNYLYDRYGMLKIDFTETWKYDQENKEWINLEHNSKEKTMKVELNPNLIQRIRCYLTSTESSPAEARTLLQQVANEITREENNSGRPTEKLLDSTRC